MVLPLQVMVTLVYWTLLHAYYVENDSDMQNPYMFFLMCSIHSWPLIAVSTNVLISKVSIIPRHCLIFMKVAAPYTLINFFGTWQLGKPVYPFLPWTDYMSLVVALALFSSGMLMYLVCAGIVNSIKALSAKKVTKGQ